MTGEVPTPREQSLALSADPEWPHALDCAHIRYLLKWAQSKPRFWYDKRWNGQRKLPWFGGDEYGRKVLVVPLPFFGEINWAFWTWTGQEDHEMREHTYQWLAEMSTDDDDAD